MIAHHLYVGCIGEGVFRSQDHGKTFNRAADGMFVECDVRALVVDRSDPRRLYLGSEDGVFVSRDGADTWERLPAPVAGLRIWSLHADDDRLLAGACPASIFRSADGGCTWERAATRMRPDCPRIRHTRVTCLLADMDNRDRFWAGVEIDGLHESTDGGRSWTQLGEGLTSPDIHALVAVPGEKGQKRLLATTNRDLNASNDGGRTWRALHIERLMPWLYTRGLRQLSDSPEVVLMGCGDGPPGSEGAIAISRDAGRTWSAARMPGKANSTIWTFAVHAADPRLVYAASVSGEVYRSEDAGESWAKLDREFGEVRGLAWSPG